MEPASSVRVEPALSTRPPGSPGSSSSIDEDDNGMDDVGEEDEDLLDAENSTLTGSEQDTGVSDDVSCRANTEVASCDGSSTRNKVVMNGADGEETSSASASDDEESVTQTEETVPRSASATERPLPPAGSSASPPILGLPPLMRATPRRPVEEVSVVARAGSTAGDTLYEENSVGDTASDAGYRRFALTRPGQGGNLKERDGTSVFSDDALRLYDSGFIALPSDRYLEASDWHILLNDIQDFLEDSHSRTTGLARTAADRAYGRQMLNFLTKVVTELGHVDLSSPERQRNVLRALRRLGRPSN